MRDPGFTTIEYLSFAILAFGLVLGLVRGHARETWRGEEDQLNPNVPPRWWLLGVALWRGWVRAGRLTYPFMVALLTILVTAVLDSGWLTRVIAYCFFALLILYYCVVFLARPKWAIAPPYRDQPGALAEWMGAGGDEEARWGSIGTTLIVVLVGALTTCGVLLIDSGSHAVGVGFLVAAVTGAIEVAREAWWSFNEADESERRGLD